MFLMRYSPCKFLGKAFRLEEVRTYGNGYPSYRIFFELNVATVGIRIILIFRNLINQPFRVNLVVLLSK